jgi:hypothetical protein
VQNSLDLGKIEKLSRTAARPTPNPSKAVNSE